MSRTKEELAMAFKLAAFPRSAKYDADWNIKHMMGPNVLWLTESLSQVMALKPGMRVLDLGCGTAISSIFLAQEFDLQVWATDLWVPASKNWERVREAGLEDRVFPIHAEAHSLLFPDELFDAIVSMDAYAYFGTDDLYLGSHFARFVKPEGQMGIVVTGRVQELSSADPPEHLQPHWHWDFSCFHSPDWWRRHWERSGLATVELSDMIPNGWKHWLTSDSVEAEWQGKQSETGEMLRVDAGRNLGFTRIVARRKQSRIDSEKLPTQERGAT